MPLDLFVRVTVAPILTGNWTMQEARELGQLRLEFVDLSGELTRELERVINNFMERKQAEKSAGEQS